MAPSTEYIVLDLLCPSLGVVLATTTFAAPVRSLRDRLAAKGSLGHLNPTPWAVMTGNCLGWIGYSYLTGDLFVLMANVPGLLVSVWLNVGACKLQYRTMYCEYEAQLRARHRLNANAANNDGRAMPPSLNGASRDDCNGIVGANDANSDNWSDSDREQQHDDVDEIDPVLPSTVPHERKVLWILFFWITVGSAVAHVQSLTTYEREQIVGYVVNVNLCFFYAAPLTTMVQVCRTRDAASIHVRTTAMTMLNSFFWLAYGLWGVHDPFIYVPNCTGFVLGGVQALLLVMFGSKKRRDQSGDDARQTLIPTEEGEDDFTATTGAADEGGLI